MLAFCPALRAQTPDAIYIGTWKTGYDVRTDITPDPTDPKLTYNEQTGCYEGEILNWPKTAGNNAFNAKIPYSYEGDAVTYYGVDGPSVQLNFNNQKTWSYTFATADDPIDFRGWVISILNQETVEDVKVSMNLATNQITFTSFESSSKEERVKLLEVTPALGGDMELDENGRATIVLTFSGAVESMEVICEGETINPTPNDDKTQWTIVVPASLVKESTSESLGMLLVKVLNAYDAQGLPVSMNDKGDTFLELAYFVKNLTCRATINFVANPLETIEAYKLPYEDDLLDITSGSLTFTYLTKVEYLFKVAEQYELTLSCDMPAENPDGSVNWSETPGEADGFKSIKLTIGKGASGATFTVKAFLPGEEPEDAVEIVAADAAESVIYNLQGVRVSNPGKGIFIINGKKTILR